jgi:excisionase family DNA binding protein
MIRIGEYMTAKEVAKMLGIEQQTVNRWARIRNLPKYEHPTYKRRYLFLKKDIEAFLEPKKI